MTNLFPNAWHVARREYFQRVRTRTFLIVTGVLALVGLAIALLPIGIRLIAGDEGTQVGISVQDAALDGDAARVLQSVLAANAGEGGTTYEVRSVDDEDEGRSLVRDGELDGLVTVTRASDDELSFTFFTDAGPTSQTLFAIRSATTQISIGDRLERAGVDPSQASDIFAPTPFDIEAVDPEATDPEELYGPKYIVAMALVILTFMAVITYGTWVATSVAEEKSSRVMELLITAATPRQLLAGKVIGNGAAGLTQYLAVAGAAGVGLLLQGAIAERVFGEAGSIDLQGIDLSVLVPFGLLFIPGFLLYCTLYAGFGSMASRQEDVTQVTGPMLFIGMGGYFASFIAINTPDETWVKVLSLVPFFSPYLLPARHVLTGNVAPWEWLAAGILMLAFLLVALWLAGRIYSAGVLLYGQRSNLRSVWRAVRVDR